MRRRLPPETRSKRTGHWGKRTGHWGQIRTFLHLDLEDLALLIFGMMYLVLLVLVFWFVIVCGGAVVIRCAHIHIT